ncbi:hypothetical protein EIN_052280 [Entamoeba invadens IP1]|uniref:hypothetical protein n=1 Tax=Entamoeba invadens IP1 TaxID=370355 RepID=UPI0002C3E8EC|nr:hypothetical protein EIN_052280 [Entamoeba invadens IP1]ELP93023.1 hypothetical protein EIN_052280 [Entamoeba invadens IP1]|eukprot:XP_004259794.1 hypothetical protein EIN_052280 [Entamoeba invadens IP1]
MGLYFFLVIVVCYSGWSDIKWLPVYFADEESDLTISLSSLTSDFCDEKAVMGCYLNITTSFPSIRLKAEHLNYVFIRSFTEDSNSHVCYSNVFSSLGEVTSTLSPVNGVLYVHIGTSADNTTTDSIPLRITHVHKSYKLIFIGVMYIISIVLVLLLVIGLVVFYFYSNWSFAKQQNEALVEENLNYQSSSQEHAFHSEEQQN